MAGNQNFHKLQSFGWKSIYQFEKKQKVEELLWLPYLLPLVIETTIFPEENPSTYKIQWLFQEENWALDAYMECIKDLHQVPLSYRYSTSNGYKAQLQVERSQNVTGT